MKVKLPNGQRTIRLSKLKRLNQETAGAAGDGAPANGAFESAASRCNKRLHAQPCELSVVYYSGEGVPCPCSVDGVMLAVGASPGQGSVQVEALAEFLKLGPLALCHVCSFSLMRPGASTSAAAPVQAATISFAPSHAHPAPHLAQVYLSFVDPSSGKVRQLVSISMRPKISRSFATAFLRLLSNMTFPFSPWQ
jgi:hypothetical protein